MIFGANKISHRGSLKEGVPQEYHKCPARVPQESRKSPTRVPQVSHKRSARVFQKSRKSLERASNEITYERSES